MSLEEVCYLSGIIDGEGTIYLDTHHHPRGMVLVLQIANTDKHLFEWVLERFPTMKTYKPTIRKGRKPLFHACWYGKEAQKMLRKVLPYLIIKQRQAELALTLHINPVGRHLTRPAEEWKKRMRIEQEIKRLNHCRRNGDE